MKWFKKYNDAGLSPEEAQKEYYCEICGSALEGHLQKEYDSDENGNPELWFLPIDYSCSNCCSRYDVKRKDNGELFFQRISSLKVSWRFIKGEYYCWKCRKNLKKEFQTSSVCESSLCN